MIKILWVDDKFRDFTDLIDDAKDFGIELVPFRSIEEGCSELEKFSNKYDGVLLDAQVLEKKDDFDGQENIEYLWPAVKTVDKLGFPVVILSGHLTRGSDDAFKEMFKNVFIKGIDSDIDALFELLKSNAENRNSYQLKKNYKGFFDAINSLTPWSFEMFFKLIINYDEDKLSRSDFNTIRQILEAICGKLIHDEILPRETANGDFTPQLNKCSRFLSKVESDDIGFEINKKVLNEFNAETFRHVIKMSHILSHHDSESPYSDPTMKAIFEQFLHLIRFFDNYIRSNPPKQNWTKV